MTIGDPQFLKTLTVQENELVNWFNTYFPVREKLTSKTVDNKLHRYDLEIDDDTHWALVKIGAEHKMHYEQYAEEVLKAHVEQHKLDQQTKD